MTTPRDESSRSKPEAKRVQSRTEPADEVVELGELHSGGDSIQDSSTGNSVEDWGSLVDDEPDIQKTATRQASPKTHPEVLVELNPSTSDVSGGDASEILEATLDEDNLLEPVVIDDEVAEATIVEESEPGLAAATVEEDAVDFAALSAPEPVIEPAKSVKRSKIETMVPEPEPVAEDDDLSALFDAPEAEHSPSTVEEPVLEVSKSKRAAKAPVRTKLAPKQEPLDQEEVDEPVAAAVSDDNENVEQEKPSARPHAKAAARRGGGMLTGTFVGLLLGAIVCAALWLFRVEPPETWREAVSGPASTKSGPIPKTTPPVPAAKPITFDDKVSLLHSGDLTKLKEIGFDTIDEDNPEQLAARAEMRWLDARRAAKEIKADDEVMVSALADLTKATEKAPENAKLRIELGRLQEALGQTAEAKKTYAKGLELFKNKPEAKAFDAALIRVELKTAKTARAGQRLNLPEAMATLMTGLILADGEDKAPEEAGFSFWKALKAARANQYKQARTELKTAREAHEVRRKLNPNRAQNPLSDPDEEIFLQICKDLDAHWEKLEKSGYPSLDVVIVEATKSKAALDAATKQLATTVIENKTNAAKLTTVEKQLDTAQKELMTSQTQVKGLQESVVSVRKSLMEAQTKNNADTAALAKLTKSDQDKTAMLSAIGRELTDAKYIQPGADNNSVIKGLQTALNTAKTVDPDGAIKRLKTELNDAQVQLKERWTPAQMLPYWIAALEERTQKAVPEAATADANRVLADKSAAANLMGEANLVLGLSAAEPREICGCQDFPDSGQKTVDRPAMD